MAETAKEVKNTVLDLEGMDQIFDVDSEPIKHSASTVPAEFRHRARQGAEHGAGMSLKAAAIHYKLALSTLRARIKRGEIPATKIEGSNGPEWRVFATSLELRDPIEHGAKQGAEHTTDTLLVAYQSEGTESANRLLELVDKQSAKLEAASGQIGYLSAQIEGYQNQVRLLPDLEAKAAKLSAQDETIKQLTDELTKLKATWWYRFWSSLSGAR